MRTPGLFMGVFALALILPVLLACRGSDEPADGPTPRNGPPPRPRWRQTSPETDREALVALYNATDGPNWTFDNNWLSDVPTSEWEGVTTDDNGRVTELSLRGHQLSGEIPPELSNLANLQELDLCVNQLSGEIPPGLGNLSNLTYLHLNDNELSGCVPSSLEDQLDFGYSALGDLPFC